MSASLCEPSPRRGHFSSRVQGQLCVWGGRTKDFSKQKNELASTLHVFDPFMESWESKLTAGSPPSPGLYNGACASAGHYIYLYGGHDGPRYQSSLHQLDTETSKWTQLASDGPMRKIACGMVTYSNLIVLFGGYGVPSGPIQAGAEFIKNSMSGDGSIRGWTNELHTFDLYKGEQYS